MDGGGFIETALPQRSSAQMVMKYHAEDTSTLNDPRWSNRLRVGRAEPDAASFGRAVSMKPPWGWRGRAVSKIKRGQSPFALIGGLVDWWTECSRACVLFETRRISG